MTPIRVGRGTLFLIGMLLAGCASKRNETGTISYPRETARLVSHVTSDFIRARDAIRVRFVSPATSANLVGQRLEKTVFTFVPRIDGTARWADRRTLLFQPDEPLPFRQQYRGILDLAALFPQRKNPQPLEFAFRVSGREIVSVDADFELMENDDPRRVVYRGRVVFSEKTPLGQVRHAARLSLGRDRIPLAWKADTEGKIFSFVSDPIVRDKARKSLRFELGGEVLAISQDYEQTLVLAPKTEMKIVNVGSHGEGRQPRFTVEFSDELDPHQDIRGLISVDPPMEIRTRAVGKNVHVNGQFQNGRHYTLTVYPGIRSRWGAATASEHTETIQIPDLKPQIRFSEDGMILPTVNLQRVRFQTVNVSRVRLRIKKVFDSNLGQFLQSQQLNSASDRRRDFYSREVNRVGVGLVDTVLKIV